MREMRILFLSNNIIADDLFFWLHSQEDFVLYFGEPVTLEMLLAKKIDYIVSYNYIHLISKSVLKYLPHRVINLHISMLPWNKGAHPNLWSFLDETPSGVTIHEVDEGLDTGGILLQKRLRFNWDIDTLKKAYNISHQEIQALFREYWPEIRRRAVLPQKQQGTGSIHRKKELLPYWDKIDFDATIRQFVSLFSPLVRE